MKKFISIIVLISIFIYSCDFISIMDGGTHGSLASYTYEVSKDSLEAVVNYIIENDNKITKLKTDGGEGTYVKISIIQKGFIQYFVFRYAGDSKYWNSHPNISHISVTATKKGENEYQTEGEISSKDKRRAIQIFNNDFIDKIKNVKGLVPVPPN
ncbi:MAG: hypothetical protein QM503_00030 [Bacteroidota bacterium]